MDETENKIPTGIKGEELLEWFEETMQTVNQENDGKVSSNTHPLIQVDNKLPCLTDTLAKSQCEEAKVKKLVG